MRDHKCCETKKILKNCGFSQANIEWLSEEEGGNRRQAPRIVAMATGLLVATGNIVLPVDYLFYPLQETTGVMDRFVPSSKQPQHWSRNYNGTQENRRRSNGQSGAAPEAEVNSTSTYGQGVTLRAEDLLGESDSRLARGSSIATVQFLSPRPGDQRRLALGGSATELAQCDRPRASVRRSSEGGNYAPHPRRKSSSSSNAADDPTSSDLSSTSCSASSSSSESGCNGDSETCNYCRLSESSDDLYECRETTDDERSSTSLDVSERNPRVLTKALSEDCNPPSRANRPLRRTSPSEYLRHKRVQMERLRNERLCNVSPAHNPTKSKISFQRCDSDPRLYLKKSSHADTITHNRTLNFVSPTRNRIRQPQQSRPQRRKQQEDIGEKVRPIVVRSDAIDSRDDVYQLHNHRQRRRQQQEDIGNVRPIVFQCDVNDAEDTYHHQNHRQQRRQQDVGRHGSVVVKCDTTTKDSLENVPHKQQNHRHRTRQQEGNGKFGAIDFKADDANNIPKDVACSSMQHEASCSFSDPTIGHNTSATPKNVSERNSRSTERRPSVVWNTEDAITYIQCTGAGFHCAVCDMSIPFTNCALCSADTEIIIVDEAQLIAAGGQGFVMTDSDLRTQATIVEVESSKDQKHLLDKSDSQSSEEKKELEEFYDEPAQAPQTPPIVSNKDSLEDKKGHQWSNGGAIHKSFNHEDARPSRRRSSHLLRKYKSEPVPEAEIEEYYVPSTSQPEFTSYRNARSDHSQSRAESSSSSSNKSEKSLGYHVVKEIPKRTSAEEESQSSCQTCDKTTEEEISLDGATSSRVLSPEVVVQEKNLSHRKSPVFLKPEFVFEPEIIHKANPLVDEAEVEVLPSAVGAFRRLSEDEFISSLNIHEAARKGDLHVVKLLTKKDPKQMETVDERGWTPIHLAAAYGHSEVVKYLATEGAHLAALDPSSYTALHLAAMNGHTNCLEVLLPMGVDIDSPTAEGFTPLHLAVMNCHLECIRTLLRWGSSMDKRDSLGRGIYEMVEEYKLEDVATLLRRYHKKMHNVKHMLEMIHRNDDRSSAEIPQEFIDILASIAEESGTD
ncbi:hypothetical protein JTE90_019219 [Oedothorax gibbosus]|uniref:Alpha-latrotoxin n=1 Tax=Oedothorax gibbosus TaxID=931172 RepID=A0AAV6UBF8_9ARAC|nr:hypothetical protein JTE90_019219 [Oedothorax gibbosus]